MNDDFLAAMDQALRAFDDMAKLVRAYYVALTGAGFDPREALTLTVDYQAHMLKGATDSKGSPDA